MSLSDVIKSIKNCTQWQVSDWNHVKFEYCAWQFLSNFEADVMLPLATEAEMKDKVAY